MKTTEMTKRKDEKKKLEYPNNDKQLSKLPYTRIHWKCTHWKFELHVWRPRKIITLRCLILNLWSQFSFLIAWNWSQLKEFYLAISIVFYSCCAKSNDPFLRETYDSYYNFTEITYLESYLKRISIRTESSSSKTKFLAVSYKITFVFPDWTRPIIEIDQ